MTPQLRDDLDLFVTAFLNRGGWGNFTADDPQSLLLTILSAALDRGEPMVPELCAEHVEKVLYDAGWGNANPHIDPDYCPRRNVAEKVSDIASFLESYSDPGARATALRKFAHLRTLENYKHKATTPSTHSRWALPVRHLRSKNGSVEAWVYGTDADLEEYGVRTDLLNITGDCPLLHRLDGPALIFRRGKKVVEEQWARYGRKHREGGPACIYHGVWEYWYRDGILHRDGGPAQVYYDTPACTKWYKDGVQVDPDASADS